MTAAYRVELACPRCGRELDHEATSRPTDLGCRMSAVVNCGHCRRRQQLVVELVPFNDQHPELRYVD